MAEAKKRQLKRSETVRERSQKVQSKPDKSRRLHATTKKISRPFKTAAHVGRKEYYLPIPENRVGRFLNKRRHFIPLYFRQSWRELRQVTWPGRKETWKLTLAVISFAIIFGVLVAIVDFGLDKLFRKVILKI